jgi:hypothetical protein
LQMFRDALERAQALPGGRFKNHKRLGIAAGQEAVNEFSQDYPDWLALLGPAFIGFQCRVSLYPSNGWSLTGFDCRSNAYLSNSTTTTMTIKRPAPPPPIT